ncbi:unnamed protein product [Pleuronectes platessa]|uniref:Uncharacterized protein n=1 Tax=Pleuronectes platessa TaxID=8262 RepID=A0A9N7UW68_PLEPL|nr:unnamed protein product [Pleuronectes platessa]
MEKENEKVLASGPKGDGTAAGENSNYGTELQKEGGRDELEEREECAGTCGARGMKRIVSCGWFPALLRTGRSSITGSGGYWCAVKLTRSSFPPSPSPPPPFASLLLIVDRSLV